ncbi:hypothetical protein CLAFUW4_05293 [Fulvia fulva]|uniref:Uncharacterized protein n=1 Tax=Passalora fulva TaxID=5499 RepID=A0A9Q8LIR2_PASFU|nr:uncharacterized protein CLAFUR5_05440 [Fulvia fulva]KAK4624744.1 hypothetical protein CLAFUR4_05287 [Fulvia fulva]KAK4625506.1 hypothetical protein CLAFUR0_05294 [Fulvia fulva]UJO18229.1 hypothetical protein CLAFUR5_05440 [Fulvia fulva]WPV15352.1 hypothetical protein CLAFUW4_05293 [Fulvia fulva]WPV29718.1 hypothetical protein CLAFUW7_05292 [Fulvia fulva]
MATLPTIQRQDSAICMPAVDGRKPTSFTSLPAELRIHILEHVFTDSHAQDGFLNHGDSSGIHLGEDYTAAAAKLNVLLTCQQSYHDGCLLAFNRTNFVVSNMFFDIPARLSVLHPKQIEAIRSLAFVADNRHFKKLLGWGEHPFGMSSLQLNTLTIVLHRSSRWHYLFDFTADIVKLLRQLEGVKRFVIVRNAALVKGSLKTWYNRLVALILKIDHQERYDKKPANPEKTWWSWSFDEVAQSIILEARPSKPTIDEESYMQQVLPLMEDLKSSIESEEWNPDPRSRYMYY